MAEPVITMQNVTYAYDQKKTLNAINFSLDPGAFTGLIGPNGGGKTTFVKLILGLLKPDQGSIFLFGKPQQVFKNWSRIGFVSQKANTFNRGFPATVYEVVAMGLTAKIGYFRMLTKKHKQKVLQTIDRVGMGDYAQQNIGSLSGGQQQRVFIARSLVNDPELLILDEPTIGVDQENVLRFYEILHDVNNIHGITLLLITHDTAAVTEHATDIVYLNQTLQSWYA